MLTLAPIVIRVMDKYLPPSPEQIELDRQWAQTGIGFRCETPPPTKKEPPMKSTDKAMLIWAETTVIFFAVLVIVHYLRPILAILRWLLNQ